MSNFNYAPGPDSPLGESFVFPDPDSGRLTFGIIAKDHFKVEVAAGDITELPGFGVYVPVPNHESQERAVFGFLHGIADIASTPAGIRTDDFIHPTLISRHEAPLSIRNFKRIQQATMNNGRMLLELSELTVPSAEEMDRMINGGRKPVIKPTAKRNWRRILGAWN